MVSTTYSLGPYVVGAGTDSFATMTRDSDENATTNTTTDAATENEGQDAPLTNKELSDMLATSALPLVSFNSQPLFKSLSNVLS